MAKLKLAKRKYEMKNDKLFEAEQQHEQAQEEITKLQKDSEKHLERKMTQLNT